MPLRSGAPKRILTLWVRFFSKLFSDHHLVDVASPCAGPTWRNGRMGEDGISKRLDRFLISDQLVNLLQRYRVWAHRCGISDHFPVILEWSDHHSHCAYPFKFNQSCLDNEDFIQMVRSEWPRIPQNPSLDAMQDLYIRLKTLKEKVKSWTKVETLKMKDHSVALEKEINSILHSSPSTILNQE